jgi:hypothetical protein
MKERKLQNQEKISECCWKWRSDGEGQCYPSSNCQQTEVIFNSLWDLKFSRQWRSRLEFSSQLSRINGGKGKGKGKRSHDSSVGTVLGYRLDDRGSRVRFPAGAGSFSLHHRVHHGSVAHPASYPMGTTPLSLRIKRLGREADHSPPSSVEVK